MPLFPKKTKPQNLTQEPPSSSLAALLLHKAVRASRRLESGGFAQFCGASRYPPDTFVFLAQRGFVGAFLFLYVSFFLREYAAAVFLHIKAHFAGFLLPLAEIRAEVAV